MTYADTPLSITPVTYPAQVAACIDQGIFYTLCLQQLYAKINGISFCEAASIDAQGRVQATNFAAIVSYLNASGKQISDCINFHLPGRLIRHFISVETPQCDEFAYGWIKQAITLMKHLF